MEAPQLAPDHQELPALIEENEAQIARMNDLSNRLSSLEGLTGEDRIIIADAIRDAIHTRTDRIARFSEELRGQN